MVNVVAVVEPAAAEALVATAGYITTYNAGTYPNSRCVMFER